MPVKTVFEFSQTGKFYKSIAEFIEEGNLKITQNGKSITLSKNNFREFISWLNQELDGANGK